MNDKAASLIGSGRCGQVEVRPRSVVETLRPYAVPAPPGCIDLHLDANEGPTPDPVALESLRTLSPERLRRYPKLADVETLLSRRFGRSGAEVILTAGGDDAIDRCCRAVLEPGRTLVQPAPTFEMIGRSARIAGAQVIEVEWGDGGFPAQALVEAVDDRTGMVAIVSPNNPTGLTAAPDQILAVAHAAPHALILADLAYAEFADADPTERLLEAPNIVIVRTFSKAAGLAGLRLGYALGQERLIRWLRTVGGPYPATGPSLAVAEAILCNGTDAEYVARVRQERNRLRRVLLEMGFRAPPSEANFVLARHPEAASIHAALLRRGISVRAFAGVPRLEDALRITCPGDQVAFDRLCRDLCVVMEELK